MFKVFLAFSFQPEDRDLVQRVEALLESHGVQVDTGEVLGGQALTPAVKKRIDASDALVALLTRRERIAGGGWTTHPWVRDEINYARIRKKPSIAMVDVAVKDGGAYQEHERIDYDARKEALALLKLSQTVGEWREQFGRLVKIRILPEALGRKVGPLAEMVRCESRLTRQGKTMPWRSATVVPEPGGTYAYIRGAHDDALIQIRIKLGAETWISPAAPQWMDARLAKAAQS